MKRQNRSALIFGAAAVGWAFILFFFSGQPGEESGRLSRWFMETFLGWLLDWGVNRDALHLFVRKCAHMSIFALEGFFVGMSLGQLLPVRISLSAGMALCAVLAVTNELHQTLSEGRVCSTTDMLIDSAGALLGLLTSALIVFSIQRYSRKNR